MSSHASSSTARCGCTSSGRVAAAGTRPVPLASPCRLPTAPTPGLRRAGLPPLTRRPPARPAALTGVDGPALADLAAGLVKIPGERRKKRGRTAGQCVREEWRRWAAAGPASSPPHTASATTASLPPPPPDLPSHPPIIHPIHLPTHLSPAPQASSATRPSRRASSPASSSSSSRNWATRPFSSPCSSRQSGRGPWCLPGRFPRSPR